jgi:hypothetical protein
MEYEDMSIILHACLLIGIAILACALFIVLSVAASVWLLCIRDSAELRVGARARQDRSLSASRLRTRLIDDLDDFLAR